MQKKYSVLLMKAKNGKKFSNVFYRFWKPVAIGALSVSLAAIFAIHSTSYSNYVVYKKNFVYMFNIGTDPKEINNRIIPFIKRYMSTYTYAVFYYNDMPEEAKNIASYYHVDEFFYKHPESKGCAVLVYKDQKWAIATALDYRAIYRTATGLKLT